MGQIDFYKEHVPTHTIHKKITLNNGFIVWGKLIADNISKQAFEYEDPMDLKTKKAWFDKNLNFIKLITRNNNGKTNIGN